MKNRVESILYKAELEKYKKAKRVLLKEQYDDRERIGKRKQRKQEDFYFTDYESNSFISPTVDVIREKKEMEKESVKPGSLRNLVSLENVESQELSPVEKVLELEKRKMTTFQEEHTMEEDFDFFDVECFLYHGLRYYDSKERFREGIKKLEGIFEKGGILAGKYLEGYYPSLDNCNELEYVSLASYSDSIEFKIFVLENICLLTLPSSDAYKTIYVSYDMWYFMKKNNIEVKNRYSYAHNEYQVKDGIPLDDVKAIGIPFFDIQLSEGMDTANHYTQQIISLLDQYDVDLPIVDTSCYNQVIYQRNPSKRLFK